MRSMTGLGIGDAPIGDSQSSQNAGKLSIEIRAVNHRYLDVRVRAPNQLPDIAMYVETMARERLARGRFDVTVRLEGAAPFAVTIHKERARSVFAALTELRDELAPNAEVPLSLLGAVPDLFVPLLEQNGDAVKRAVTAAFTSALTALDEMRIREGGALAEDVRRRLASVTQLAASVLERSPHVLESYRKRLKERADRLRAAADVEIDRGRLEQELALYADRVDIAEELTRLASHVAHFDAVLASPEAVGRRLDFLLQEMAREVNTVGAKSQDVGIAHAVVELKAEIERMREQVQNIE